MQQRKLLGLKNSKFIEVKHLKIVVPNDNHLGAAARLYRMESW